MRLADILKEREKFKLLREMRHEYYAWVEVTYPKVHGKPTFILLAPTILSTQLNYTTGDNPLSVATELPNSNLIELIQSPDHHIAFAYGRTNNFHNVLARIDYKYELYWIISKLTNNCQKSWTWEFEEIANKLTLSPITTLLKDLEINLD